MAGLLPFRRSATPPPSLNSRDKCPLPRSSRPVPPALKLSFLTTDGGFWAKTLNFKQFPRILTVQMRWKSRFPPGKLLLTPGQRLLPPGKSLLPTGKRSLPSGIRLPSPGKWSCSPGKMRLPLGKRLLPAGKSRLPSEKKLLIPSQTPLPQGKSRLAPGKTGFSRGKSSLPWGNGRAFRTENLVGRASSRAVVDRSFPPARGDTRPTRFRS